MSRTVIAAALCLLVLACRSARPPDPVPDATLPIFVVRRAWHIDVGFAAPDLQLPLRSVLLEFPTAAYLEFGFGDRHYLLTRDHGPATLLGALWPGPALVLVTALRATPQEAFGAGNVIVLRVTPEQAQAMQKFIWHTMTASDAAIRPVAAGPYEGSVFYAAVPEYSALHTCNTWAAQALRAAGLPIHSTGVEFAGQLWSQLQAMQPSAGPGPAKVP
jgi:uncharacterized protein (TIGR02117 family)